MLPYPQKKQESVQLSKPLTSKHFLPRCWAGGRERRDPKCFLDGHNQEIHETPRGKGPNLKPLYLIRSN